MTTDKMRRRETQKEGSERREENQKSMEEKSVLKRE